MEMKFNIETDSGFYDCSISNYKIYADSTKQGYEIYFNKERLIEDIRNDIAIIDDKILISKLSLRLLNLIKSNLIKLSSKYIYTSDNIEINKDVLKVFNIVDPDEAYISKKSYNWEGLLLEILVNLRKYIINLSELAPGHIVVNNNLIQEETVLRVKNRLYKIEKLCILPGNKDMCIVKYYLSNEFFVEYEDDVIKYMKDVSNEESKVYNEYFEVIGG